MLKQLRIRQHAAEPSSGTRGNIIRTVRSGRTIAPAPNSVCGLGLGRLRELNVAVPVPDGEIDAACDRTSRSRSPTMVEGPPCLSLPPACEFASGTHPPVSASGVRWSRFFRNCRRAGQALCATYSALAIIHICGSCESLFLREGCRKESYRVFGGGTKRSRQCSMRCPSLCSGTW